MITNKKNLAAFYGISTPTLNKWLSLIKELNIKRNSKIITPAQLKIIVNHLGTPENYIKDENI